MGFTKFGFRFVDGSSHRQPMRNFRKECANYFKEAKLENTDVPDEKDSSKRVTSLKGGTMIRFRCATPNDAG
jgi:hypothetical protein